MIEHVTDLLGAYLDGELRGQRRNQVEDHLTRCAACRKELEQLRGLSALLQETVPAESFTPADRFVANLTLRLPRRSEAPSVRKSSGFAWWLVPAGVVGVWVFMQTVFTVSNWVTAANFTGLFGQSASILHIGEVQNLWFSTGMNLFGSRLGGSDRSALDLLNEIGVFGTSYVAQLIWQAGLGVLILGWLSAWLGRRNFDARAELPKGEMQM
jgi:anti-sigma factor RsiW